MGKTFETEVRSVGTSFGVLIPKDIMKEMNLKKGQKIRVGIIKEDPKAISKYFGIDKGAKPFKREHDHRDDLDAP